MNKKIKITVILFLVCVATSILYLRSYALQNQSYNAEYFGAEKFAETKQKCTIEDKKEVQPILDEIEKAFRYGDDNNDCEKRFGALSTYCICKEFYPEVVNENHTIKFVTAKINKNCGYIWIKYDQEGIDKNGEVTTGSGDILARIEIKKVNGKWIVVCADEPA